MLPKPPECRGCPLFGNGMGYVPDEIREGTELFILFRNPGANEVEGQRLMSYSGGRTFEAGPPRPLIGATGFDMEHHYLPKVGLAREQTSIGNCIRCRWNDSDELPPVTVPWVQQAIMHCQSAYFHPPKSTKLIVAGGEHAMWAATAEDGAETGHTISSWRGWLLPYNPPPSPKIQHASSWFPSPGALSVLVTYHLAFLFRSPWEVTAAVSDWIKAGRFLRGTWPEPFPLIRHVPPALWPRDAAFDTEYDPESGYLLRWSLATRDQEGVHVWVVEGSGGLPRLPAGSPRPNVYLFNAAGSMDIHHLVRILGLSTQRELLQRVNIEDVILMHHSLWSDLDHTLDYVGSIYARTNFWKHLEWINHAQYAGGDALGTWDAGRALLGELSRDPASERGYRRRLGFVPILLDHKAVGLRTHETRVREVATLLEQKKLDAMLRAQALVGWPMNIGSSQQVAHQLYDIEHVHLNPMSGKLRVGGMGRPRLS